MKKLLSIMIITMITLSLFSCYADSGKRSENAEGEVKENSDQKTDKTASNALSSASASDGVKMTAAVVGLSDKIEVEVIEGEYGASGIYWVITSSETDFIGQDGGSVMKSCLKVGDIVEIIYNGQVMMSYPPQIVAKKITIK